MCSTGFWGSKQNRIAVWAPTKPPARNGQFAKTFLGPSTLTLVCARHAAMCLPVSAGYALARCQELWLPACLHRADFASLS